MKKSILFILSLIILGGLSVKAFKVLSQQNEEKECVKKYRSEWGRSCSACQEDGKTYSVFLKNECLQTVDVKCAVQEVEKRWRTFTRLNLAPGDSMTGYACNGSGKYLYWVRKAGDKTYPFPADEEINMTYAK